ncbi:MAG: hypothetical protein ABSH19_06500, partial [Opitutales bacterium]
MNNAPSISPRLIRAAILALTLAVSLAPTAFAQPAANTTASTASTAAPANTTVYFSNWPAGADPKTVGIRVAENVAARKFRFETMPNRPYVIYPEVIAWFGALRFAHTINNTTLQDTLVKRFDYFLTDDGATHISHQEHV